MQIIVLFYFNLNLDHLFLHPTHHQFSAWVSLITKNWKMNWNKFSKEFSSFCVAVSLVGATFDTA